MPKVNDLSRCLTALDPDSTLIAVIEMSQSSWLVAASVPGIERHPAKKLEPDAAALLRLLDRWQAEAERPGCRIERIAVAYEAGATACGWRGGCGRPVLTRRSSTPTALRFRASIAGPKPTGSIRRCLKRVSLGWLRGEPDHCQMIAVPSLEEEDAKRPSREREALVGERTRVINRIKSPLVMVQARPRPTEYKCVGPQAQRARSPRSSDRLLFIHHRWQQTDSARLDNNRPIQVCPGVLSSCRWRSGR